MIWKKMWMGCTTEKLRPEPPAEYSVMLSIGKYVSMYLQAKYCMSGVRINCHSQNILRIFSSFCSGELINYIRIDFFELELKFSE